MAGGLVRRNCVQDAAFPGLHLRHNGRSPTLACQASDGVCARLPPLLTPPHLPHPNAYPGNAPRNGTAAAGGRRTTGGRPPPHATVRARRAAGQSRGVPGCRTGWRAWECRPGPCCRRWRRRTSRSLCRTTPVPLVVHKQVVLSGLLSPRPSGRAAHLLQHTAEYTVAVSMDRNLRRHARAPSPPTASPPQRAAPTPPAQGPFPPSHLGTRGQRQTARPPHPRPTLSLLQPAAAPAAACPPAPAAAPAWWPRRRPQPRSSTRSAATWRHAVGVPQAQAHEGSTAHAARRCRASTHVHCAVHAASDRARCGGRGPAPTAPARPRRRVCECTAALHPVMRTQPLHTLAHPPQRYPAHIQPAR